MTLQRCDKCGGEITQEWDGGWSWDIGLKFKSAWNPNGETRLIQLCQICGAKAARGLGFCFDTGKILSIAKGEYITECMLTQSLPDIAINGVACGHNITSYATQHPDEPAAGAMGKE